MRCRYCKEEVGVKDFKVHLYDDDDRKAAITFRCHGCRQVGIMEFDPTFMTDEEYNFGPIEEGE